MKNTKRVDENNEYVTKGFLKETSEGIVSKVVVQVVDQVVDKVVDKVVGQVLEKVSEKIDNSFAEFGEVVSNQINRLDKRIDTLEANMVTKKDLLQMHDNFVSRSEFNGLSARVGLVEETVYE